MQMAGRRVNGDGSLYQRTSDRLWMGVVHFGYDTRGNPIRKSVSARTKREAAKKLTALVRQRDDGLPPPDNRLTVKDLLTRWYDEELRIQVAPSTAENYRSIFTHHIVSMLGRKTVANLTMADVNRLMAAALDEHKSASTVRRIRAVLVQALDYAVREGVVGRNVAALTKGPKMPRKEGRTLTPDQAKRLLSSLAGHRYEVLYVLMLTTGLRRGEALGLRWEDLDLSRGIVMVRRLPKREGGRLVTADTKTAKSRRAVNLPAPVILALRDHRTRQKRARLALGPAWHESGFVFTSEIGTPVDPRNLYRDFASVCQKAKIGKWHPHELRHSAASLMLAQGVPLQVVSDVLGHSSIRLTADVYGHVLAPARQAAADAMTEALWT
jgi:integrase